MEDRKKDHIDLAFQSRVEAAEANGHFFYELIVAAPQPQATALFFFGKKYAPAGLDFKHDGWHSSGRKNQPEPGTGMR
ncbi:hypothetical protein [Geofilum rubicundum]|uniref:hypothetical protein n=1 Tax=Geofilum rubicundum TaxID=472113 RepID=UPI001D0E4CE4|nr:hypothetical protein [Geofilum rubicundum]